jgi:hypothetical protein
MNGAGQLQTGPLKVLPQLASKLLWYGLQVISKSFAMLNQASRSFVNHMSGLDL